MANKVVLLTSEVLQITGLEVYRDISMRADLNQANIFKSYKEVVPMIELSGGHKTVMELSGLVNPDDNAHYYLSDLVIKCCGLASNYSLSNGQEFRFTTDLKDGYDLNDLSGTGNNKTKIVLKNSSRLIVDTKSKTNKVVKVSKLNPSSNVLINTFDDGVALSDISNDYLAIDLADYMIQGEISALDFVKLGFNIKAQVSDTYYVEEYGEDPDDFMQFFGTEEKPNGKDAVKVEGTKYTKILLLENIGQVSALANWRESQMWNPYKLAKLVNVKAVFNSLHNIFTWTPGERILNPEFGNNLKKFLYEGITEFNAEAIISEIRRCISEFEPRVRVIKVVNVSTVNDTENNTILLDIIFSIPSLSRELFIYSYTYKHNDNT